MTGPQPINDAPAIPPLYGIPFHHYVAGYALEVFIYGINFTLFSTASYLLLRNGRGSTRWLLFGSTAAMFIISTASVCTSMHLVFNFIIYGIPPSRPMVRAKHLYYLVNNVIADTLLISRCYFLWSQSIKIILFPSIFLVTTTVFGAVFFSGRVNEVTLEKYVYLWLTLGVNVTVTSLIACRIWWMAHRVCKHLGCGLARKDYSPIAIFVESGAIYSLYVILDQVLIGTRVLLFVFDPSLAQISTTALTLIIVQVGLGREVRDVETNIWLNNEPSMVLSSISSH